MLSNNNNENETENKSELLQECAIAYNNYHKEGLHARWELIVQRQAAGFIVGNHKLVQEKFPIGDALPVSVAGKNDCNNNKPKPKKFTDQLDWWASIGRWK
jgi:hypothetical protein